MDHDRTLEADQDGLRSAVAILNQRIAVLELRAKGTDEDIRSLKRDLRALTKEPSE